MLKINTLLLFVGILIFIPLRVEAQNKEGLTIGEFKGKKHIFINGTSLDNIVDVGKRMVAISDSVKITNNNAYLYLLFQSAIKDSLRVDYILSKGNTISFLDAVNKTVLRKEKSCRHQGGRTVNKGLEDLYHKTLIGFAINASPVNDSSIIEVLGNGTLRINNSHKESMLFYVLFETDSLFVEQKGVLMLESNKCGSYALIPNDTEVIHVFGQPYLPQVGNIPNKLDLNKPMFYFVKMIEK